MQMKLLGPPHPDIANSLALLGMFLLRQGKLAEAEEPCRGAAAMRAKVLPRQHWHVSQSFAYLGIVLARQGKVSEAREWFDKAAEIANAEVLNFNGLASGHMWGS